MPNSDDDKTLIDIQPNLDRSIKPNEESGQYLKPSPFPDVAQLPFAVHVENNQLDSPGSDFEQDDDKTQVFSGEDAYVFKDTASGQHVVTPKADDDVTQILGQNQQYAPDSALDVPVDHFEQAVIPETILNEEVTQLVAQDQSSLFANSRGSDFEQDDDKTLVFAGEGILQTLGQQFAPVDRNDEQVNAPETILNEQVVPQDAQEHNAVSDHDQQTIAPEIYLDDEATQLVGSDPRTDSQTPDIHDSWDPIPDRTPLLPDESSVPEPEGHQDNAFILKGRFEVLENMDNGGMGMVYKAFDTQFKQHVAIKILHPSIAKDNPDMVEALKQECLKTRKLRHDNIITVHDFGDDQGFFYIYMDLLTGQTLKNTIQAAKKTGGIKLAKAWPLIEQMAKALAYAHKQNVVHRDFKPGNVFVDAKDKVTVLDFGIALDIEASNEGNLKNTLKRGFTPRYASLEMHLYQSHEPDCRDDIYSFGLVVYELLAGRHPYDGDSADKVFVSKGNREPLPIKGLTSRQWRVLKSAIALPQAQRPDNLDDWLKEFQPRSNLPIPLIGGIAAACLSAIAGFWYFSSTPVKPTVLPPETTARVFSPPIAKIAGPANIHLGESVMLDASASKSGDNEAISYQWRIIAMPAGSTGVLQNANADHAQFTPDLSGDYTFQLQVTDKHNTAQTDFVVSAQTMVPPVVNPPFVLEINQKTYKIGQELKLKLHTGLLGDGYLRIANLDSNGDIGDLLPNPYQSSKVKADADYEILPKSSKSKLQIGEPVGNNTIVAVFSQTPLPKLENIIDSNGSLVPELQVSGIYSQVLKYQVVKK